GRGDPGRASPPDPAYRDDQSPGPGAGRPDGAGDRLQTGWAAGVGPALVHPARIWARWWADRDPESGGPDQPGPGRAGGPEHRAGPGAGGGQPADRSALLGAPARRDAAQR